MEGNGRLTSILAKKEATIKKLRGFFLNFINFKHFSVNKIRPRKKLITNKVIKFDDIFTNLSVKAQII